MQEYRPETWKAFNRRITGVVQFLADGSQVIHEKVADIDGPR